MGDLSQLSEETRRSVETSLRGGQKIAAIKKVRQETGLGLKEAKEAVEEYMSALGISADTRSSGCLLVLVVLGAGLALGLVAG
jgi:ribosomal protein L7/L12